MASVPKSDSGVNDWIGGLRVTLYMCFLVIKHIHSATQKYDAAAPVRRSRIIAPRLHFVLPRGQWEDNRNTFTI